MAYRWSRVTVVGYADLIRRVRSQHERESDFLPSASAAVTRRWGDRTLFLAAALPLLLLLAGSFALGTASLDVRISRSFYDRFQHWLPDEDVQPWAALYDFGCYPGLLVGAGGLVVALIGTVVPEWKSAGKGGLILAAVLAIGPGLMVNTILKPNWGRPRPKETIPFGGKQDVCPFWQPGTDPDGHSFPCGHASMGFYLMAPGFLVWRKQPRWALVIFGFGVSYGSIMGLCRLVQGGHFASDIVWSGAIVYFTCVLFYVLVQRQTGHSSMATTC